MGRSFTRQELYDLVWSQPRTALAKQLGVSDVWIGKKCRAARIPMPPAGHWASAQHGKVTIKPPLPIRLPGQPRILVVGEESSSSRWVEADDLEEPILPPVTDENIDVQVDAALSLIGRVPVTRDLSQPHAGLSRVLRREADRRTKFADSGWSLDQPLFDGPMHQRQLRLFNSLCLAFDRMSAKAEVYADQHWIQGLGSANRLHLRIDFGACALDLRVLDPKSSAKELGEKPPRAPTLRAGSGRDDIPIEEWCDGDGSPLEQQLTAITRALLYRAEKTQRHDVQRHYEWRLERRQERIKQLEAQRLETERKRLAAIEARRKKLRDDIKALAQDARVAQDIRDMVERMNLHPDLQRGKSSAFLAWRAEALELADRLDPMLRPIEHFLADFAMPAPHGN